MNATPYLNREKLTLLLNLENFEAPDFVKEYATRHAFSMKKEFHVTVVGNKAAKLLLSLGEKDSLFAKVDSVFKNTSWTVEPVGKFYHVKKRYDKEFRESIIQIVTIPSLEKNIAALSDTLNSKISMPFAHVTLFTKHDAEGHGIGIDSADDFLALDAREIFDEKDSKPYPVEAVYIPSRLQVDTAISIFLLREFGKDRFPGIEKARIEIVAQLTETFNSLLEKRILAVDHAGGPLDHHGQPVQITSSRLVASYLHIDNDTPIAKMLALAERCDFYGQGIISPDLIDKAFGFPGLVTSLNRKFENDPNKVFDVLLPLLHAHLDEEMHKTSELPNELKEKREKGETKEFSVVQRGKPVKVIMLPSNDSVMSGFLRSGAGGGFDVVVQWLTSGHVNIITKQVKRISLESLIALIRKSEAMLSGVPVADDMHYLASQGRIKELPQWYYDPATNTLQNGGINPKNIDPTRISKDSMAELVRIGLSEELWKPGR